ncbi:hypothetical protein [uncultured Cocleimonas sp.]|uniref:hypothetical protein n=1 Tax=uncultured Cocleimonas sp. TaxID=1051587 RepID=UPI002619B83F|nr:hypothetical protein [uncultured Cocleimonas sp.]
MKISELIAKADDYIGAENRKRKSKINCLKHVLNKLRKREKKLELKFAEGRGSKEKISNELALIHAHRKKGLKLLKELKEEHKEAKINKEEKPSDESAD